MKLMNDGAMNESRFYGRDYYMLHISYSNVVYAVAIYTRVSENEDSEAAEKPETPRGAAGSGREFESRSQALDPRVVAKLARIPASAANEDEGKGPRPRIRGRLVDLAARAGCHNFYTRIDRTQLKVSRCAFKSRAKSFISGSRGGGRDRELAFVFTDKAIVRHSSTKFSPGFIMTIFFSPSLVSSRHRSSETGELFVSPKKIARHSPRPINRYIKRHMVYNRILVVYYIGAYWAPSNYLIARR